MYRLAGFWTRFLAYIIDLLTIGAISGIILRGYQDKYAFLSLTAASVGIIGIVYFLVMTKKLNQTLGKMILGIKVIRTDNQELDWKTLIYREGIGRFISQLLGLNLGYIWSGFHPKKQAWHDMISDTYVVFVDEVANKHMIQIDELKYQD